MNSITDWIEFCNCSYGCEEDMYKVETQTLKVGFCLVF